MKPNKSQWGDGPNGEGHDWSWTAESQQAQSDDYEKNPPSKPSGKQIPWSKKDGKWGWHDDGKTPF